MPGRKKRTRKSFSLTKSTVTNGLRSRPSYPDEPTTPSRTGGTPRCTVDRSSPMVASLSATTQMQTQAAVLVVVVVRVAVSVSPLPTLIPHQLALVSLEVAAEQQEQELVYPSR